MSSVDSTINSMTIRTTTNVMTAPIIVVFANKIEEIPKKRVIPYMSKTAWRVVNPMSIN